MSNSDNIETILCEEVFDEYSAPTEEEVIDYAKNLGIDPKCESHLLPIARNGLMQPLPSEWKPCYDSTIKRWYYYNADTKKSQWEHPLDSIYRKIVKRGRSEGYSSAAEDDSKLAAKEDLKSFEEVSDILSSKSNEIKIDDNIKEMAGVEKIKTSRTHQPLLLRRRQLQSGKDPIALQVAKVMNTTMKKSDLVDYDNLSNPSTPFDSTFKSVIDVVSQSVTTTPVAPPPKHLQPLRRSLTLDPISLTSSCHPLKHAETPIKGILRESSFTGLHSKHMSKSNPLQGEVQDRTTVEVDDEKKRSVRFADFERKALDIRFQFSDSGESISEEVDSASSSPEVAQEVLLSPEEEGCIDINNVKILEPDTNKIIDFDPHLEDNKSIDPNNLKDKLLSRQAIVAPLKIDHVTQSGFDDETSLIKKDSTDKELKTAPDTTPIYFAPVKEAITSRFTVSAVKEDDLHANNIINNDNYHNNVIPEIIPRRKISSNNDYNYDSIPKEMEELARKKAAEKLAVFEEKLTKEIQEKIFALKKQQSDTISDIKENLLKFEENEKKRLENEADLKLVELKTALEEEYRRKEFEIRSDNEQAIEQLKQNLIEERTKLVEQAKEEHSLILNQIQAAEDERLNVEKKKLDDEFNSEIQKRKEMLQSELDSMKKEEEEKINQVKIESDAKLLELEEKYKCIAICEERKFENDMKKIEQEFNTKMTQLKVEKESELKRVQTEWEDKITATTLQHKTTLESAMIDHENSMLALRNQFQHEEDDLKKYHAEQIEAWNARLKKLIEKEPNSIGQINRDFEKMRCEKRLIEDKYRSLKDKYLQLKTDMKVAVERKLQSRARRKRENLGLDKEFLEEKDKNDRLKNNNAEEMLSADKNGSGQKVTPRILLEPYSFAGNEPLPRETGDNDPSSDDQHVSTSLSSTFQPDVEKRLMARQEADKRKRHSRVKGKPEKYKERQGNVLDDVRTQLQELEEIEEQIPANSHGETYLRYPFHGPGLSTSAEVDFYRHRVIVEQEAVRAARECLLQQKRELEARQNILRTNNNSSTMQQLQQQERDLTEMEVSLHRTRALLGEKMIRLRLLGQTLNRLVDDTPSNTNSNPGETDWKKGNMISGFPNETVPFNVLQNLENINSEIREIWSQLSKQQNEGCSMPVDESAEVNFKPFTGSERMSLLKTPKPQRRTPSTRTDIEARIQGLREWLQKPQPSSNDWNQLTL